MSYCINPWCPNRQNIEDANTCATCNSPILINNRFRVLKPLKKIDRFHPFDVFEAVDLVGCPIRKPNTTVVLKILKDDDETYLKHFEREFDVLKKLKNLAIPQSDPDDFFKFHLKASNEEVLYCLVMSKIEGETLTEWIYKNGRLNQDTAIDWLGQLSEIIDYIHNQGYFHRDIKPDNIIVQPNQRLALVDFGGVKQLTNSFIAKLSTRYKSQTQLYSLLYSSPEQLEGRATPQSDFYSLGRTFIYAATGKELNELPVNEKNNEILWMSYAPQLATPLKLFIQRLTNPIPARRPLHSAELVNIIFDTLPLQLQQDRFLNSNKFKAIAIVATIIGTFLSVPFNIYLISGYYYNNGISLFNRGELAKSRDSFYKSVSMFPTEESYYALANACNQSINDIPVDKQCVIDSYTKIVLINKNNSSAYYNLAAIYDDKIYESNTKGVINDKYYFLSLDAYKKAIKLSNGNPIYINNLARLYIIRGEYRLAIKTISTLISHSGKFSHYTLALLYKNLGWAELKQHNQRDAVIALTKSISYNQPLAAPYCLLSFIKNTYQNRQKCFDSQAEDSQLPEVLNWHIILKKN